MGRKSLPVVSSILDYGHCYDSVLDPISGKTLIRCRFTECSYKTDKNSNFKRHLETMHQLLNPAVTCCGIRYVHNRYAIKKRKWALCMHRLHKLE